MELLPREAAANFPVGIGDHRRSELSKRFEGWWRVRSPQSTPCGSAGKSWRGWRWRYAALFGLQELKSYHRLDDAVGIDIRYSWFRTCLSCLLRDRGRVRTWSRTYCDGVTMLTYEQKHPTFWESVAATIRGDRLSKRQQLFRILAVMFFLACIAFARYMDLIHL